MKINEIITESLWDDADPAAATDDAGKFNPYYKHNLANPDSTQITPTDTPEKLVAVIESNCSEMLNAYRITENRLLRGIRGAQHRPAIITAIRPDRRPVQMGEVEHDALHDSFVRLGLTATRKNSIFCTTRPGTASDWGTVYVIFVKDGWSGTVFDTVRDDYTFYKMQNLGRRLVDSPSMLDSEVLAMNPRSFSSTKELVPILRAKYADILVTGDSYIGVMYGTAFYKRVASLLGI